MHLYHFCVSKHSSHLLSSILNSLLFYNWSLNYVNRNWMRHSAQDTHTQTITRMGRETVSNPTNWLDIRLNWLTGYIRRRSDHKRSKSHTHSHKIRIDATWEHRMCVCSICRKSNVMHSRWLLFYLNKKKRREKRKMSKQTQYNSNRIERM